MLVHPIFHKVSKDLSEYFTYQTNLRPPLAVVLYMSLRKRKIQCMLYAKNQSWKSERNGGCQKIVKARKHLFAITSDIADICSLSSHFL